MTPSDRPDEADSASGEDGVIRASYDWETTAPSIAVIELVAIASDREPTGLEPLYEVLDPDALDALVGSNGSNRVGNGTTVSFEFAGQSVTVNGGGGVMVRPAGEKSNDA